MSFGFPSWVFEPPLYSFYCGDLKSDHLKSKLFEDGICNDPVFKGLGYSHSHCPNHLKTEPFEIRTLDFKLFLAKWRQFVKNFICVGLADFRFHSKLNIKFDAIHG